MDNKKETIENHSSGGVAGVCHLGVGVRGYPEGIDLLEVPKDLVACDAVVQILVRNQITGPAFAVMSRDGKAGAEVSGVELFRAWYALGREIMRVVNPDDPSVGWMNAVAEGTITSIDHVQRKGKLRRKTGLIGLDGNELLGDGNDVA